MLDMPQHDNMDVNLQPRDDGFPADQCAPVGGQRGKSADLRFLPHQQQLHADNCPDRLRELGMPFDDLAAD